MALGIEFKNGSINLVEAKLKKNGVICKSTHSFEFNHDWVDQQGVSAVDFDNFVMLFEQKLIEFDIKDRKDAYLCLNNSSIISREIITPKIDEKKLGLIVRSEMMDALNLTPNYIMDYIMLEEIQDEEGKDSYRLLAVAVLDTALESYLDLMREIKVKPVVIDSATNAIIKTVGTIPEIQEKDQVIITEVGNGHLRLYLFDRGMYVLSRNIKMISYDELTKDEYLATIEDNISKMIQFSYTRGIKNGIEQIYLIGKDDELEEIEQLVKTNLLVNCMIMKQPEFVSGTCPYLTQYTNVLGTLLRKWSHDEKTRYEFTRSLWRS